MAVRFEGGYQVEVVTTLPVNTALRDVAGLAQRIEGLGFDTVHVPETVHDSLAVALLALEHTSRITVRTSLTLAFPRSPMVVAYAAWDLARFSPGRFQLGVGTQVRGNIEGRFSVEWSDPAGRLADYLRSLRVIFDAFGSGGRLSYDGDHYRFNRLQPYFNPGGSDTIAPPLWTGGVNPKICQVAGALADGFVTHPTNSHPRFLRQECFPALAAGAVDRRDGGPRIIIGTRCISAPDEAHLDEARDALRPELALLYSTPAYRPTLALTGHAEMGERLTRLVRQQRWDELPHTLTDDVMADLLPEATYAELPDRLAAWYEGMADGLVLALPPSDEHDDAVRRLVEEVRHLASRSHDG